MSARSPLFRRAVVVTYVAVALAFAMFFVVGAPAQELTMPEIEARIRSLEPKPADFRFVPPAGWKQLRGIRIAAVRPAPARIGSDALTDGDPYTVWVAPLAGTTPEAILDLGADVTLNRLVVFSRFTDARGTGGGNNAVRRLGVAASDAVAGPWRDLTEAEIEGPAPMCFKKAGGQICTFIDRAKPTLITTTTVRERALKVRLLEAYWTADALPEWKSSIAISEILLYLATPPASH
jgi:hypothetical protein